MADAAEILQGDGVLNELKETMLAGIKAAGIPINATTLKAFSEGIGFSIHSMSRLKDETRTKEILMLAMAFSKLYSRELKK